MHRSACLSEGTYLLPETQTPSGDRMIGILSQWYRRPLIIWHSLQVLVMERSTAHMVRQAMSDSEGSEVLASIPSLQYSDQVLAEGFWIIRLRLRMTYSYNRNTLD